MTRRTAWAVSALLASGALVGAGSCATPSSSTGSTQAAAPADAGAPAAEAKAEPAPPPDAGAQAAEEKAAAEPRADAGAPPPKAEETKADAGAPAPKAEGKKPPGGAKYALVAVPAPDKKVERLFKSKCASCHGNDGKGATEKGKKMKLDDFTLAGWQTSHGNDELKKTIVEGFKGEKAGVKQEMDAFKDDLAPDQVDALVQYVRWLGAPK